MAAHASPVLEDVLGIIPARGGSKGIPRKNIRLLAGRPLIQYTCDAASAATTLTRIVLSTDDREIADAAASRRVEVPFLRPTHLGADATPTLDVVLHVLRELRDREGYAPQAVVLLQPTAPFRTAHDIDDCVRQLSCQDVDSVVSVACVPTHFHGEWQLVVRGGYLERPNGEPLRALAPRRQALCHTYYRNGAVYAVRTQVIHEECSLYGQRCMPYVMPAETSINIDGPVDWKEAERYLQTTWQNRAAS